MQTVSDTRRLDICMYKVQERATIAECVERFGVSESAVNSAIRWGERRHLFEFISATQADVYINEIRKHLEWLDQEIRFVRRASRDENHKRIPMPVSYIRALSAEKREWLSMLMKMQGVYADRLNVEHTGKGGAPLRVLYEAVVPNAESAGQD